MAGTIFRKLLDRLNLLSSLGIMLLIVLISADVIGRAFFGRPLSGVPEIVRFSVVVMFWLQMAYVLRTGGHLRTTLIFDMLPAAGQRIVHVVNTLAGSAIMAMIVWFGIPELIQSWQINEFEGALPVRIPVWPIWTAIVACAALTAVQYTLFLTDVLRGNPLPEDAIAETEAI